MIKIHTNYFDLDKIADSGQCFRWRKIEKGAYMIPAFGKELLIWQNAKAGETCLNCSWEEYEKIWKDYFDLGADYEAFETELRIRKDTNEYLYEAAKAARGIRILRQDLWETIVSFIISQNNNIPKIKNTIKRLCERYDGFPTANQIVNGGSDKLNDLGLGYRKNYVLGAAILYRRDGENILKGLDYKGAMKFLLKFVGIGPKVANCICLYGLGHKEAFPRDVWIKRIEAEHFGGHFPDENYPGYAGVYQQYIFYFERSKKECANGAAEKNVH